MYVIYEAYDDNTADVLDIGNFAKRTMTEQKLIRFGNNHDILGLSVSGQKINYITAYNCLSFASEDEADDYIKYNGLSYQNKRYAVGYYWVFEKKNRKKHVDYYIYTCAGDDVTYVTESGYSPYIQVAKSFDKKTAKEKAALMTKNSRTGKHWSVKRVCV